MATTATSIFEPTIQKTNQWLEELTQIGEFDDEAQAYSALRAVLQTLRDRLIVNEAADLGAQLPLLVRGFYFEGWKPSQTPQKVRKQEEFLEQVQQRLRDSGTIDPRNACRAVFQLLENRITAGECKDVRGDLPEPLRELWPQA